MSYTNSFLPNNFIFSSFVYYIVYVARAYRYCYC